jgi:hypothetical protein
MKFSMTGQEKGERKIVVVLNFGKIHILQM